MDIGYSSPSYFKKRKTEDDSRIVFASFVSILGKCAGLHHIPQPMVALGKKTGPARNSTSPGQPTDCDAFVCSIICILPRTPSLGTCSLAIGGNDGIDGCLVLHSTSLLSPPCTVQARTRLAPPVQSTDCCLCPLRPSRGAFCRQPVLCSGPPVRRTSKLPRSCLLDSVFVVERGLDAQHNRWNAHTSPHLSQLQLRCWLLLDGQMFGNVARRSKGIKAFCSHRFPKYVLRQRS